jgi:hypothetical protein
MQASGRAKRVLIRRGLYVNILVTNHIIVYLSSKSRKKHYGKYHSMQAAACGRPNQAHASIIAHSVGMTSMRLVRVY